MRTTACFFRAPTRLLLTAGLAASALVATAVPSPVTQSWSARIDGLTNSYFEVAGISAGASGDVFVAGHSRRHGFNPDILVCRYDPSGTRLWQKVYEPAGGATLGKQAADIVARGTNVYVVGTIVSTNGSGQDFLTLKYRDTGDLEWAARLDGEGHFTDLAVALAVDALGNVLVVGDSIGTNGTFDIVVLKYGPTGALLWKYSYDGPDHRSDRAVGIRVSASGSVHVAGTTAEGSGESSVVTLKLNADGQEQWTARETSTDYYGVRARGFDVDSAGNVVTVATEKFYCVTWKYDANGVRQWMARYRAEEPASMQARDVRFDGNGNVITAANLYGSGTNDAVLIKYATDGQQLWATRIVEPNGVTHLGAMDGNGDGHAYVTMSPNSDMLTVKVGTNGAQLWSATYNSSGSFADYAERLEVAPSGDVFVAGRSILYSESFVSLVKYTQQSVPGVVTAVVTPALQVVDPGTNVFFTAETSGPGPIQFQWRMNGRAIPDATNATLALTNVLVFHRGDYSVVVSNLAGATVSPEARLSVRTPPEVFVSPTQTVAYVGTDTAFFATLSGNEFVTLQWRHNGTNITGATNEILELVNLNGAAGGVYDVVASTFGGTTTSSAAGLRISGVVQLFGVAPQWGSISGSDAPQLRVLSNGEFLIAARSNHLAQGSSILLRKHDTNGTTLWSALFDSPEFTNAEPSSLVLDAAGNVYLAGVSRQPYLAAAVVVLKYDPGGQLLWSRIVTGTDLWDIIPAFAVDSDGNSTLGILSSHGTKVIRYNSDGDVQWSYVDPSPDTDTIAVAVDSSGNSFLGTTIRVEGDNEIRLRKFDSVGATLWTKPDVDGMYNRLGSIAVDSAGNLIVAGTGELGVSDSWMFVQKHSPSGQRLWETRTGSGWSEISQIVALSIGPGDEISILTRSDDDYEPGEQSGLTRIGLDGQLRFRIAEPQILVSSASQVALDNFGNAYVTGSGAMTAKYDMHGNRLWKVSHAARPWTWKFGIALGVDAAGDVRVLVTEDTGSGSASEFSVLHYRQRDPAGTFRVQLIRDAAGTFHLGVPAGKSFQIEASTDLQNWSVLGAAETDQLLQPGGTAFSGSPRRFFRLISTD